jgi:hypothetical protein
MIFKDKVQKIVLNSTHSIKKASKLKNLYNRNFRKGEGIMNVQKIYEFFKPRIMPPEALTMVGKVKSWVSPDEALDYVHLFIKWAVNVSLKEIFKLYCIKFYQPT